MADCIYLDHCATTPILPEVAEAVREVSLRCSANPSSQHQVGRECRRTLETARERIAELLGARTGGVDADRVIFTSGGTEANNLAMFGLLPEGGLIPLLGGRVLVSAIEHPSVIEAARNLQRLGWQVDLMPVDGDGVVRIDQLDRLLTPETRLVSLMLGNNETGVLQPVAEVARRCADRQVRVHTDGVQVVGKLPVDFRSLGVDALSCTAHKFHGPQGIGVLLVKHGVPLHPILYGGHQQADLRPGTESVALAVGMQVALECWHREAAARQQRLAALQSRLESALAAGWPDAVVVGRRAERLPHLSNISFTGLDRQALMMALDMAGVACSTGSACASGSSAPSPVLAAMGFSSEAIDSSIRLSWGARTSLEEIEESARRILRVCKRLRQG